MAARDPQFRSHHGLRLPALTMWRLEGLLGRQREQPPTTITSQLARNLFSSSERSWQRLAQEGVLSLLLEYRYSKD